MSTTSTKFLIQVPLEEKVGVEQRGTIKVGSQIITQLSKGVYSTPESALKELISNAYDADASTVTIETKSSASALIIKDDGTGMNYTDFDEKFAYISKSPKPDESAKSKKYERPIIGRLGIGFIAVSAICDTMVVSSASKDSEYKFIAVLDFSKFKRKEAKHQDFYEVSEYRITLQKKEPTEKPYTHVELRDLEAAFRNTLLNRQKRGGKIRKFTNPKFTDVVRKMWSSGSLLHIGKTYGPYWKFVSNLASIIPVEYMSEGPIRDKKYSKIIKPIKDHVANLKFKVNFDGMELRKPYLFPTKRAAETGNYDVFEIKDKLEVPGRGKLEYHGYMYSQDGGINVDDWRGIIIRIKNTSVGNPSQNFLDYSVLSDSLYFKWTFGEVYVTKGLEEAMNIDRATFKTSDPEYSVFIASFHKQLQEVVFNSVQNRWRERVKKEAADIEGYKERWRTRSLLSAFNKKFEFIEDKDSEFPISISKRDRTVIFNPKHELFEFFPRKERALLKDILFAAALSRQKHPTNPEKQEDYLLDLLWELGRRYPKPKLKYEKS